LTTETYGNDVESDVTVSSEYSSGGQTATNSTPGAGFQHVEQVGSTTVVDEDDAVSPATFPPHYFHPDFVPGGEDKPDSNDVVFYVDSMFDTNSTSRYDDDDDDYYVALDDDELRSRDLERVVVVDSAVTSPRGRHVTSLSRDASSVPVTSSSFVVSDRQRTTAADSERTAFEYGHRRPSSVSGSIQWTATTKNPPQDDDDEWWRQFPFLVSVTTVTPAGLSVATLAAAAATTSGTVTADVSSSTTTLKSAADVARRLSSTTLRSLTPRPTSVPGEPRRWQ